MSAAKETPCKENNPQCTPLSVCGGRERNTTVPRCYYTKTTELRHPISTLPVLAAHMLTLPSACDAVLLSRYRTESFSLSCAESIERPAVVPKAQSASQEHHHAHQSTRWRRSAKLHTRTHTQMTCARKTHVSSARYPTSRTAAAQSVCTCKAKHQHHLHNDNIMRVSEIDENAEQNWTQNARTRRAVLRRALPTRAEENRSLHAGRIRLSA